MPTYKCDNVALLLYFFSKLNKNSKAQLAVWKFVNFTKVLISALDYIKKWETQASVSKIMLNSGTFMQEEKTQSFNFLVENEPHSLLLRVNLANSGLHKTWFKSQVGFCLYSCL